MVASWLWCDGGVVVVVVVQWWWWTLVVELVDTGPVQWGGAGRRSRYTSRVDGHYLIGSAHHSRTEECLGVFCDDWDNQIVCLWQPLRSGV